MSDNKHRRYYLDWWEVKASTVYTIVAVVFLILAIFGGSYWLYKNNWVIQTSEEEAPHNAARIVSFQGEVRIIRVSTRKTENVIKETPVMAGDTLQTQSDGRAQIRMIDGSELSIRPNSTVVIRDSKSIFGGTSVRVKLDDGQIRVRTEDQTESSDNIVEVKETENHLSAQTDASFNLNPKENRGEIRISRGSIVAKSGDENTTINENEFVALNQGKLSRKEKLIKPPRLVLPENSKRFVTNKAVQNVELNWENQKANSKFTFQLQLSESPFFGTKKIITEKYSLDTPRFTSKSLPYGTYFWRVRTSSSTKQTSEWSEHSRFVIAKPSATIKITASEWEVEKLSNNLYHVRGTTKPGATVQILNRETFARSDGVFLLQVLSNSSHVTVNIFDEAGNNGRYNLNLDTAKTN